MKILITGGAGFVGSNLALDLADDHEIIALDNLRRRGSELNLQRLRDKGISFVHGDIRIFEDLMAVGEVDLVLECSAEPSVMAGIGGSPSYVLQTNLGGTLNCLEYARRVEGGMIFLSTSRVYPMGPINQLVYRELDTRFEPDETQEIPGVSPDGVTEDFPLAGARSLYGATKLSSELIIHEYIDTYGMSAVINRCGVISGPWQMGKVDQGVVVLWVARHHYGKPLTYIGFGGRGKQVRDVLHIGDLSRLIRRQVENLDPWSGKVYNVGGGRSSSVSLLELTGLCEKYTGKKISIEGVPETRPADVRWFVTDAGKIDREMGWKPEISTETLIEEIARWIADHSEMLEPILG